MCASPDLVVIPLGLIAHMSLGERESEVKRDDVSMEHNKAGSGRPFHSWPRFLKQKILISTLIYLITQNLVHFWARNS